MSNSLKLDRVQSNEFNTRPLKGIAAFAVAGFLTVRFLGVDINGDTGLGQKIMPCQPEYVTDIPATHSQIADTIVGSVRNEAFNDAKSGFGRGSDPLARPGLLPRLSGDGINLPGEVACTNSDGQIVFTTAGLAVRKGL